jgi:hypothetical protein
MLKNSDLSMIVKHVMNDNPRLRKFESMQKQATTEHNNQDNINMQLK